MHRGGLLVSISGADPAERYGAGGCYGVSLTSCTSEQYARAPALTPWPEGFMPFRGRISASPEASYWYGVSLTGFTSERYTLKNNHPAARRQPH